MSGVKTKPVSPPPLRFPKPRNGPGETSMMVYGIPEKVKSDFKTACARKKISMRQTLISLLTKFVNP